MLSSGWPIAFNDAFSDQFMPDEGVKPFRSVVDVVVPGLKDLGVPDAAIKDMTDHNAHRFLSTIDKGGY